MTTPVDLPSDGPDGEVWAALCEVANGFPGKWTIIGARMVELHARERLLSPPRGSADADTLADARSVGSRPEDLAAWLEEHGWDLDGMSPTGIGHRLRRGLAALDVLAPDHLGGRARLATSSGARTIVVPGGRSALDHGGKCRVQCGSMTAVLPRPELAGALIVKARAIGVDDVPDAQRTDLAFLCSLIDDVEDLRAQLTVRERSHLARLDELTDAAHPAWREAGDRAELGYLAFMRIIN